MTDTEHVDAEVVTDDSQLAIQNIANLPVASDGVTFKSPEEQVAALNVYAEARTCFKHWLESQLTEGVHYGFPPFCEPKKADSRNWVHKKSLYKAGAQLIVDMLKYKAVYTSDIDAWKMAGSVAGNIVRRCTLSNQLGEEIGSGTGAFTQGEKKSDIAKSMNGCIKMADKRALVAAVINAVPVCADLFTQDLEDYEPEPKPQATPKGGNVGHPTRGQQSVFSSPAFAVLKQNYAKLYPDDDNHQKLVRCSEIMEVIYREQGNEQACDLTVPVNWKPEIVNALNEHFAEVLSKREADRDDNAN